MFYTVWIGGETGERFAESCGKIPQNIFTTRIIKAVCVDTEKVVKFFYFMQLCLHLNWKSGLFNKIR